MKGVAFITTKGGTGKTSLSHALALGASWCNVPSHLMHTDNRPPIKVKGRPYMFYDAREAETLVTLMNAAINSDGLCIIDGGGNRPHLDKIIAQAADLAIIPVTPDPEDVTEALAQYDRLKEQGAEYVRFLINKFPANENERRFIFRYINELPEDMIIGRVPDVKAIRQLREGDVDEFKTPPSRVNNLARALYRTVMGELMRQDEEQLEDSKRLSA